MLVTPSRIFLAACIAAVLGIGIGVLFPPLPTACCLFSIALLLLAGLGVIFISFGFPRNAAFGSHKWLTVAAGAMLLALAFGAWRGNEAASRISYQAFAPFDNTRVHIEGTVARYPDYRIEQSRYVLDQVSAGSNQISGKVLVFAETSPQFSYGDRIGVRGKLRMPEPFDGFNYPRFLAKDGIAATVRADELQFVSAQEHISFGLLLAKLRAVLDRSLAAILPPKESGIMKALLVGDEGGMTVAFKEALNRSGLRHIVAVSGMNITIIVGMVAAFFLGVGLWRHHAFWATVIAVTLFVLLIGAPASATRAAIMGLSARLGYFLGRSTSSLRLLVASAAAMALLSPLSLIYDLGFQLSFAAALGMVLLAEPLGSRFAKLPLPKNIRDIVATTFSAQLFALPLLFLTFGRMSLVFLFTNLVVLPVLPYITMWGWVASAAGMASSFLGTLAALPLAPYLSFVAWAAEQGARVPMWEFSLAGATGWTAAAVWWAALALKVRQYVKSKPTPADRARALVQNFTE